MLRCADEGCDWDAVLTPHRDHLLGRHAECVGYQLDGMIKRCVEQFERMLRLHRDWSVGRAPLLETMACVDAMLGEQVECEVAMLLRHATRERSIGDALLVLDRQILRD